MDSYQPIKQVFSLGSRHPRQVGWLRVGLGIWLLFLTANLYRTGHAGRLGWLLAVAAAAHFCLAFRLFRIARRESERRLSIQ